MKGFTIVTDDEKKAMDEALSRCTCPPLHLEVHPVSTEPDTFKDYTPLANFLQKLAEEAGITQEFVDASNHDYYCRCEKCKGWWQRMGPDEEGSFGPFSREEIRG